MLQDQNNQEKFEALLKSFGDNTAEFYTNPIAHLQKAGIPLIPAASIPPRRNSRYQASPNPPTSR